MKYHTFLDSFFIQIEESGLSIDGLPLDHIAYQASSAEDYDGVLGKFSPLGELVSQEMVGGRRVAVFRLIKPLIYKDYQITVLELVEPRPDQKCESGFQHAEFVTSKPCEEYISQYPDISWDTSSMNRDEFAHLKLNFPNGLTLKFLQRPILEMFEEKKQAIENNR